MTQVDSHTCMPLRVFMIGMAFRNSGSRQLLLDAIVEMDRQTLLNIYLSLVLTLPIYLFVPDLKFPSVLCRR